MEVFNFLLPDLSPKHWSNIKSLQLKELIHNDQLLPFQTLKTRYLIPSQGAYTYKRIASYLKKNPAPSVIIPTKAWSSWTSNSPKAKGITLMYNLLKNKDKFTKTSTYKRWERDLQASFSDSQWRSAIHYNHKASSCIIYWELSQKIHHRWHFTPVQMYKFANLEDDSCWRGCSSKGSLIHILWDCPHIHTFWRKVFSLISDITGIIMKPTLSLAILGIGLESFPYEFRTIMMHILFAARLLIMRK